MIRRSILFILLLLVPICAVFAQFSFTSVDRWHNRALSLVGENANEPNNFHTRSNNESLSIPENPDNANTTAHKSPFEFISPEIWLSYNTFSSWGTDDGSSWQGKGLNATSTGGIEFKSSNVSIAFLPRIWFAQNVDFEIINTPYSSGYGDYWTTFDNLQRYGDESYYDVDLGDTDIRFRWQGLNLGISNENIIIGPGQMNNILLSDNAGGFPHIDVGTDRLLPVGNFGAVEVKLLWGMLEESEFFDNVESNNYALLAGMYLAVAPELIPNLSIGFNHQYYKPTSDVDGFDILRPIPFFDSSNSPTDTKDMMISTTFSWIFPEVGFEFYGEWARNDNFSNLKDLFNFPEHTQGYTIGVNQIIHRRESSFFLLSLELTALSQERTMDIRAAGPWYRHGWAGWTQGYTNKGQIPGAAIGPGSDSQWLKVSWFIPDGSWGLSVQRIAHDKDYYYTIVDLYTADETKPYSELNVSLDREITTDTFSMFFSGTYIMLMGYNYEDVDYTNIHAAVGFKYRW